MLSEVLGADVREYRLEQIGTGSGRKSLRISSFTCARCGRRAPFYMETGCSASSAAPTSRLENRSRSGFGDLSATELRATYDDLTAMVASARIWHSALCWLSPTLAVGRIERDAVGRDGERYTWTLIDVAEIRDGRVAWTCQFELDDEAAAFAYVDECMRAATAQPRPHS